MKVFNNVILSILILVGVPFGCNIQTVSEPKCPKLTTKFKSAILINSYHNSLWILPFIQEHIRKLGE